MELLGSSLEDLFQQNGSKFSLKTTCMIADQMIERMQFIHEKHIVHRDIKPDNFLIGTGENSKLIYLIDFGLANKFRSSKTLIHHELKNHKKLTGTARYASINALIGLEQSRRDDLEAIGYCLLYFLRGSLPWQGLKVNKEEDRYKKIHQKKLNLTPEELCKGFPSELAEYLTYTRNLQYEQDPDYDYLKGLFKKIMIANNWEYDHKFDWIKELESSSTRVPPTNIANNHMMVNNNPNQLFDSHNVSLEKVKPSNINTLKNKEAPAIDNHLKQKSIVNLSALKVDHFIGSTLINKDQAKVQINNSELEEKKMGL